MMLYWIVPVDFIFTVRQSDKSIVEAYTPSPIVVVVRLCGDSKRCRLFNTERAKGTLNGA